jgi:hypothetical protein
MSYGKEHSEFNGTWRQAIYGASPTTKSKTPRELVIKLDGDTLMLTMKGPGSIHSIDITFQIGGPEATYTGLDGDEFHIKVTRHGKSLVFDGREHEESRDLPLHEMWTLRNEGKGQVLVDTKNAKSTGEPAKVSEYERVNQ